MRRVASSVPSQTMTMPECCENYLSDPYKRTLVAGVPMGDVRPDVRNQLTWLTRLRKHIESTNSTLHLDYRFYVDDWEIHSHTFDVAWYQTLWKRFSVIPGFRYYSQSQAKFYGPYFTAAPSDGIRRSPSQPPAG